MSKMLDPNAVFWRVKWTYENADGSETPPSYTGPYLSKRLADRGITLEKSWRIKQAERFGSTVTAEREKAEITWVQG